MKYYNYFLLWFLALIIILGAVPGLVRGVGEIEILFQSFLTDYYLISNIILGNIGLGVFIGIKTRIDQEVKYTFSGKEKKIKYLRIKVKTFLMYHIAMTSSIILFMELYSYNFINPTIFFIPNMLIVEGLWNATIVLLIMLNRVVPLKLSKYTYCLGITCLLIIFFVIPFFIDMAGSILSAYMIGWMIFQSITLLIDIWISRNPY